MAHQAQKDFFNKVKARYPESFTYVKVLDCGSLNVNGTLKDLFTHSVYIGVDIVSGSNVDVVSHIKDIKLDNFDMVVSGEMLEHDNTWRESLQKMYDVTKSRGLIAISCAGKGRAEHGTRKTGSSIWGTDPDYYMNLEEKHIREVYKDDMFMELEHSTGHEDTYFYGIKV